MNRKLLKLILIGLFFIGKISYAQEKSSLYSFYSQSMLKTFNSNPINYYNKEFKQYTQINLFGDTQYANIKHNQQAYKEQNIGISVDGIYKRNNTIFIGELGYKRNYLDEIGFKQSNFYFNRNEAELSPYYLLTYGDGNWDNQDYTLNGQVIFPVLANKLYINFKVNYKTAQFFRAEEPATKITYLDYDFFADVIYKLNAKNSIGFGIGFGKLNKEIDLNYFDIFSNIPNNADIYNRIAFGYGAHIAAQSDTTKEQEDSFIVQSSYNFNSEKHLINIVASFKNRDNNFLDVSSARLDGALVGSFNSKKINTTMYWLQKTKQQQLTLNANYTIGENFRVATQGKNYEVTLINASAKYQFFKAKNNIITYDFGIKTELNSLEKTDFQIVNSSKYTTLYVGGFYGRDFKLKNNKKLFIQTELGSQFALDKNAFFSVNDPLITQVEAPKFHLETVTQISGTFKVGYQTTIKESSNLTLELGVNYLTYFDLNKKIIETSNNLNYGSFLSLKYTY